ncbi:MAG: site-specific integrase [Waterburya sp.]
MRQSQLEEVNQRLFLGNVGVSVEQYGSFLSLRATLPPKPNSLKTNPHQQRISLGIRANPEGFKLAEKEARKVGALKDCGEFDWALYIKSATVDNRSPMAKERSLKVKDLVKDLEIEYFAKTVRNPTTEKTWNDEYARVFRNLEQEKILTEEMLREVICIAKPNTRTRRRYALACIKLADFAKLEHSLKALTGNYSPKQVNPRDLPDDRLIAQSRSLITDPRWQWVYGMMATYGLRNHEIFWLDLKDFPIARVRQGKTNERIVYPLYLEWANEWELSETKSPKHQGQTNSILGGYITKAFVKYQVPFHPYDLRHAWAVRSLEFGMDISLAAAQMGHSVKVHSETYHHWISKDVYQRAYDRLLANPNRPLPPTI